MSSEFPEFLVVQEIHLGAPFTFSAAAHVGPLFQLVMFPDIEIAKKYR